MAGMGRQQGTALLRLLNGTQAGQLNTGAEHPGAGPGWGLHAGQVTVGPGDIVQGPRPMRSADCSEPSL